MQLQPKERDKIAIWLASGLSQRQIALRLKRSQSTISQEISRNRFRESYEPHHAQRLAIKRRLEAISRQPFKSKWTYSFVLEKLKEGWSPEQICGRLKTEFQISLHWETIYRFIYAPVNKSKRLWEYLPLKRKRRLKKYGRRAQRVRIPDRISIHSRDKSVDSRKVFGHWEGDTLIGKQIKGKVIHTEVERKTRFLIARLINSKTAPETNGAQRLSFSQLPAKTVTTDNGLEFVLHQQLNQLGIKTYFADPYCSGQRGTNENTNGLLRRFLPKKVSFENLSQEILDDVVWEINNRPRKVLNFSTPQEVLESELRIKG